MMTYENEDGLFVEWCGKHQRFDDNCELIRDEVHHEKFSVRDMDGIDFAMWECDPVTFTYKDLEVTMVAYNTDCLNKDKTISDQTEVVNRQNKRIRDLMDKNKELESVIKMMKDEKEEGEEEEGEEEEEEEEDKTTRAEEIARRSFKVGRNPTDSAGLDTDDEEWMRENPDCEEYVLEVWNELKKEKEKKQKQMQLDGNVQKFHYLAEIIDPSYETNECLDIETHEETKKKLKEQIQKDPNISYGDLLFIGSTYESRQEYGFAIVKDKDNGKVIGGEDGVSIALEDVDIVSKKLKYGHAILRMKECYPDIYEMFSYWGEEEEGDTEKQYREKDMWD